MSKNVLVDAVYQASFEDGAFAAKPLTRRQAGAVVDAFIAAMTNLLEAGGPVNLRGFGTLRVRRPRLVSGALPTVKNKNITQLPTVKFVVSRSLRQSIQRCEGEE